MIKASCEQCSRTFSIPDKYAGKKGRCKSCGGIVFVQHLEDKAEKAPFSAPDENIDNEEIREKNNSDLSRLESAGGENNLNTDYEFLDQQLENLLQRDYDLDSRLAVYGTAAAALMGLIFGGLLGSGFGSTLTGCITGAFITTGAFWLMRIFGVGRRGNR